MPHWLRSEPLWFGVDAFADEAPSAEGEANPATVEQAPADTDTVVSASAESADAD